MRFDKAIYAAAFECDGSHRDLYVLSTSLSDWQVFLDLISSARYQVSSRIDGRTARTPPDAALLFAAASRPLLQIHLSGVTLNCHFFSDAEIELDLDPWELKDDDGTDADAILAFMAELGEALRKPVLMTAENARDAVLFRYDPITQHTAYEPSSGAASG